MMRASRISFGLVCLAADLVIPMACSFRGNYGGPPEFLPSNPIMARDGIPPYAKAGELTIDALNELLVPRLQASPAA